MSHNVIKKITNHSALTLTLLNKFFDTVPGLLKILLPSGPLPLNSFLDIDTFFKSYISFKPLNLERKKYTM